MIEKLIADSEGILQIAGLSLITFLISILVNKNKKEDRNRF